MKAHHFFASINWDKLLSKGYTPPLNPCKGQDITVSASTRTSSHHAHCCTTLYLSPRSNSPRHVASTFRMPPEYIVVTTWSHVFVSVVVCSQRALNFEREFRDLPMNSMAEEHNVFVRNERTESETFRNFSYDASVLSGDLPTTD